MAAKGFKNLFSTEDVLRSEKDPETGALMHQTGDAFGSTTDANDCEDFSCPAGFASMPPSPTGDGEEKQSAQFFKKPESDYDVILGHRDLRMKDITGALKPGETCVYSGGTDCKAQARILLKANGSINLYTKTGNTESGEGMGVFIHADGSISIVGKNANAIFKDGEISIFTDKSSVQISGGTINVSGSEKVFMSAPSVVFGSAAALPTANQTDIAALAAQLTAVVGALATFAGASTAPPAMVTAAGGLSTAMGSLTNPIAAIPAAMNTRRTRND